MRSFSTDAQCRELLERLRWPEGPKCDEFGVAHDLRVGGNIKTILGQFALNFMIIHLTKRANDSGSAVTMWRRDFRRFGGV
jgi:hypothetical protein